MKKSIYLIAAMAALFTVACNEYKTIESGLKYRIITDNKDGKAIDGDTNAVLYMNYKLAVESSDSTLVETFTKNNPVYIPVVEPNFRKVFELLSVGDSAEMVVNADTFFMNSFGQSRPAWINEGDNIKFIVKVVDIMNQEEIMKKEREDMANLQAVDSIALTQMISTLTNAKKTESGLHYVVEKAGKGKAAKKGDTVKVLYKGSLLNGQVFDENLTEGITFPVGLGQVIPGWDEMLQLMKEGDKFKAVIPWTIAYGNRGKGPIPPFSSLVFEMELVKVN